MRHESKPMARKPPDPRAARVGRRARVGRIDKRSAPVQVAAPAPQPALGTPAHTSNGAGAERLKEIAQLLGAAVAELDADGATVDDPSAAFDTAGTLRLLRAFERISSPALQRALTTLAEEIAGK
jgi:hypothetical protein